MTLELPPIVKLSDRLLVDVEQAVRRFARFHKYTFGSKLRDAAFELTKAAHKAWTDREHRDDCIKQLVAGVDDVKLLLQLGKNIRAFSSFGQFEHLARTAREIGKQVGGWNRQSKRHSGQNAEPRVAPQRAHSLSTRAASYEANP
jgi:hypothetical protein